MVRNLLAIILLISLIGCSAPSNNQTATDNRLDVIKQVRSTSVFVVSPQGMGTGVLVEAKDKIYVWTAAHVVNPNWVSRINPIPYPLPESPKEEKKEKSFEMPKTLVVMKVDEYAKDGIKYIASEVKVIAIGEQDKDEDLALLEVKVDDSFREATTTFIGNSKPPIGTRLLHAGNYLGPQYPFTVVQGIIANRNGTDDITTRDIASFDIRGGSSGGGVFLENDGRCVGILVARIVDYGLTPALYIPVRRVRAFAKKHKVEYALPGAF